MNCKTKSFMTKKKAFTLIELLIVIAIIGILFIVLVSKVDFATDKAKTTGVQADFRSFQVALETVSREHAGFATLGWDTGDIKRTDFATAFSGYTYVNEVKDAGDRVRNSYDEGDKNLNGRQDPGETWVGRKVYTENWTGIYALDNPGDENDKSAYLLLEEYINKNLDPKLHITIDPVKKTISMRNGMQDPWRTQYHGFYLTNAKNDGKDRGAIVMYSNGPNQKFGSEQYINGGVVTIGVPGNNVHGQDDLSIAVYYSYYNGYGEIMTTTAGFSNNQTLLAGGNGGGSVITPVNPNKPGLFEYEMLMGFNQVFVMNTDETLTFKASIPYDKFIEVRVNGQSIDNNCYTSSESSTIIVLENDYLRSLSEGQYSIEIVAKDGYAKTSFSCVNSEYQASVVNGLMLNTIYLAEDGTQGIIFLDNNKCSLVVIQDIVMSIPGEYKKLDNYYECYFEMLDITTNLSTIDETSVSGQIIDSSHTFTLNKEFCEISYNGYIICELSKIMGEEQVSIMKESMKAEEMFVEKADYYHYLVLGHVEQKAYYNDLPASYKGLYVFGGTGFSGNTKLKEFVVPDGWVWCLDYFIGCENLEKFVFSDTCSYFQHQLNDLPNLKSIHFGKMVKNLGDGSISNLPSLTTVTFDNNSLVEWDNYMFCNLPLLEYIQLPDSLDDTLLDDSFSNCPSLKKIVVGTGNSKCNKVNVYVAARVQSADNPLTIGPHGSGAAVEIGPNTQVGDYRNNYYSQSTLCTVILPDGLTQIDSTSFYNSNFLKSITLGKNVETINISAFYGAAALESITFNEKLITIKEMAFQGCAALKSIVLPEAVLSVEAQAFKNCTSLTEVYIPAGVVSIGTNAFAGCTSLEVINFGGTMEQWNALDPYGYIRNGEWSVQCLDGLIP